MASMDKLLSVLVAGVLLGGLPDPVQARSNDRSLPRPPSRREERRMGDAGPQVMKQAMLRHDANLRRQALGPAPVPATTDVGDVAVVVDNGAIVTPAREGRPFDIGPTLAIEFKPVTGGFKASVSTATFVPPTGDALPLGDDDTMEVPLGFSFPFLGATYTSMFLNTDGNVTFGAGDATHEDRNAARLLGGPPRIAPLLSDLDPSGGFGFIVVELENDQAMVTWEVAEFDSGDPPSIVQLTLFKTSVIRFSYLDVKRRWNQSVTIGLAPGGGQGPVRAIDVTDDLPATIQARAIYEEFPFTRSPFDLVGQGLQFAPSEAGFKVSSAAGALDPQMGAPLALGDFESVEVPLGFPFPFRGTTYASVFVNSNGNITLGQGDPFTYPFSFDDPLDVAAFTGGPPRVAPLFAYLTPGQGGSVRSDVRSDRVVVTWLDVPGLNGVHTFQATLRSDGRILFAYGAVPARVARVGVTAGGFPPTVREVDYSTALPVNTSAASIYEKFGFARKSVDVLGRRLSFTPASGGFEVAVTRSPLDPNLGLPLAVATGQPVDVALGFSFPFLGASYDHVFVNPGGNITFGEADPAGGPVDRDRLVNGPPRVLALGTELDVSPGQVSVDLRAGKAAFTWSNAFDLQSGLVLTFQIILRNDGTIRFAYANEAAPVTAVVGLAQGHGQGAAHEVDLSAAGQPLSAGAIFEPFEPPIRFASVDVVGLAQEFYRSHPDKFDFLVFFTDFPVDLHTGTIAFEMNVSNYTSGIGLPLFDISPFFGSAGELESLVMMGNLNLYWHTPAKMLDPPIKFLVPKGRFASFRPPPGHIPLRVRALGISDGSPAFTLPAYGWHSLGLYSPMSLLGHEISHRWIFGALPFVHPLTGIGPDSFDLTADFMGHRSFYVDARVVADRFTGEPRASLFTGNAILDLGGPFPDPRTGLLECTAPDQGAFLTEPEELMDGWSELDEYLLGLRRADEVSPFFYLYHPRVPGFPPEVTDLYRGLPAVSDHFMCGQRVDVRVEDIQQFPGMGPRQPALGDEDDDGQGTDVKTMAFVLLSYAQPPSTHDVQTVDKFRRTFEAYANGPASGGRGRFDTRLSPPVY